MMTIAEEPMPMDGNTPRSTADLMMVEISMDKSTDQSASRTASKVDDAVQKRQIDLIYNASVLKPGIESRCGPTTLTALDELYESLEPMKGTPPSMALYNLMASHLDHAYGDTDLVTAASSDNAVAAAWKATKKAIAEHMACTSGRHGQLSALHALAKRYKGDESWSSFIRWIKNAFFISMCGHEVPDTLVCYFLFSQIKDPSEPIRTLFEAANLQQLQKYLGKYGAVLCPPPKSAPQVASVSIDAAREHLTGMLDVMQQVVQTPAVVAALQQARPLVGNSTKRDPATVKCYICGVMGHFARDCTARPHPKGQALST